MRICLTIYFLLLVLALPAAVGAQDPAEELPITAQAWAMTDLDAEEGDEAETSYAIFLSLDDGAVLVEVVGGADVVYTLGDDGLYTGAPLVPNDAYEFEATLEIVDDDTIQIASTVGAGVFTSERNLLYERTDLEYTLWVEGDRDLTEYTMFAECLGRVDTTPPRAFVQPDPILPIRLDDEEGVLYMGDTALPGGGGTYERVDEGEFGQFTQVTTQTAIVSEDMITFSYVSVADERDDCELRYETVFTPFDGDYEALFARATELGEDS